MHRHLDLGSFIFEANGVRWAIDPGSDHETYMRHENHNARTDYYRIRAEGHNTLVFNPDKNPDQELKAKAPITKFASTPKRATATLDLTQPYAKDARKIERTFEMIDRNHVTITDEIEALKPADLWWFMHTKAKVVLDASGRKATLTQDGKTLHAEILSPPGATFETLDAHPFPSSPHPKKQEDNKGIRKLSVHIQKAKKLRLVVKLTPQ